MAELTMGIKYQVDMDKPTQATRLSTRLYQRDEEANRITLELVRGGQQADVGTLTVTGEMERADGVRVPCEGSQSGSTVSIVLNEHCYYVPGPCVIYLMASAGGVLRTMLELHGQVVQKSAGPMVDVNEELVDVDAVIQLYGEMRTAKEEAERATAAADEAATDAANAATRANDASQSVEGLTVSASPGAAPDAEITEQDGVKHIHFTLQTGATPDITFEVATGEPGTQVQVQQSGTPEAPHVKLTIPRGDTGTVDGIDYYEGNPNALGTASPGTANGVARGDHVHPMPTDVDASKLGGKAPEYYIKPRNLLDNSDLTNPINQLGQTLYTAYGPSLDRWILESLNGGEYALNLSTGYVQLGENSYLQQRFPSGLYDASKAYTCGIWYADGEVTAVNKELGQVSGFDYFNIFPDTKRDIKHVAVYEGEYTAEALPPYMPKGYAAEWVECRRYYKELYRVFGSAVGSVEREIIINDPHMRVTPTISHKSISGSADAGYEIISANQRQIDIKYAGWGTVTLAISARL